MRRPSHRLRPEHLGYRLVRCSRRCSPDTDTPFISWSMGYCGVTVHRGKSMVGSMKWSAQVCSSIVARPKTENDGQRHQRESAFPGSPFPPRKGRDAQLRLLLFGQLFTSIPLILVVLFVGSRSALVGISHIRNVVFQRDFICHLASVKVSNCKCSTCSSSLPGPSI